jgi:hypothetical protein
MFSTDSNRANILELLHYLNISKVTRSGYHIGMKEVKNDSTFINIFSVTWTEKLMIFSCWIGSYACKCQLMFFDHESEYLWVLSLGAQKNLFALTVLIFWNVVFLSQRKERHRVWFCDTFMDHQIEKKTCNYC